MTTCGFRQFVCVATVATALAAGVTPTAAQAPQAQGAIPRTPEGKPDFSGFWQAMSTAAFDIEDHSASKDVPAGLGVVEGGPLPYLPAAAERKKANAKARLTADPVRKCYLPGVPRAMYMPYPMQIIQTPTFIGILFEFVHGVRHLALDGTPHPSGHLDWWMGDSRAKWEGDTLVVDVTHFNDQTWFDAAGNFHSDALHLVERLSLMGPDHLQYEVTVEDPKTFTRPWKLSLPLYRHKERNFQLLEYECNAIEEGAVP